jgi:hypothetical protein
MEILLKQQMMLGSFRNAPNHVRYGAGLQSYNRRGMRVIWRGKGISANQKQCRG